MVRVLLILAFVLTLRHEGRAGFEIRPYENSAPSAPQSRIDELVFGRLKQLGIQPANLCSDAVFVRRVYLDVIGTLPTAQEAREFLADQDPEQAQRPDRSPAGAGGVRRLLGDEVERPAAGQVGVPDQPLAQRGAGVSPLDSDLHQGEHALRPVRPGDAHGQRQQLPRAPGQLLPGRPEQGAAGHRPGRGADVHGSAGGELAEGATGRTWRSSSRRSATSPPANGKKRSSSSIPTRPATTADVQPPAAIFPDGTTVQLSAGPGPARGLRRLADRRRRIPGSPGTSSTASGPGCWGAASSTSRTTSGRTIRRAIPSCWPSWSRSWSRPATT